MSTLKKITKGSVLLSEPYLNDPNFIRSVVLIIESGENGHFGLVLNQQILEGKLSDFLDLDLDKGNPDVYFGGPVEQESLHYIHTLGDRVKDSIKICDGLYYGGEFEHLKMLLEIGEINEKQVRFFIGYSGWSKGQLEEERKANSWLVSGLDHLDVFEKDSDKLWQNVLRNMGGKFKVISNYPIDPNLN